MRSGWRNEPARHSLAARGLRSRRSPRKSYERKSPKEFKHPDEWEPEWWEVFRFVAEEIEQRQSYGVRSAEVRGPSMMLSWSNAGEFWYAYGEAYKDIKPGDTVQLDANEILLPWSKDSEKGQITETLANNKMLPALPLYMMSTEAQERGLIDPKEAQMLWAIHQYERIQGEKHREDLL